MILDEADFAHLQSVLRQRAGMLLEREQGYLIASRLGEIARGEGLPLPELLSRLRKQGSGLLQQRIVEAMTTNETFFFRDRHPFDALREVMLPDLIQRRSAERTLRIWSAACSTGQELYSVAMLVRDHFPALLGWDLQLIGTDLSAEVVERACRGKYSALEVSRGLTPLLLGRHFEAREGGWQVREEVKRMVTFRPLNLLESWGGLGEFDVVLLRNVLIYLDVTSKRTVLGRVRKAMKPNGYLLLGAAETTLGLDDQFGIMPVGKTMCYQPSWPSLLPQKRP